MKPELEVARDAVRAALGDELADALEWAAAAVKHRATLLLTAQWAATDGGACPDCGGGHYTPHDAKCPTAEMLHALDPEWSREEVDRSHEFAPEWRAYDRSLGGNRIPPRPPFGTPIIPSQLVTLGPAPDPARLTYSAGTAWPIGRDRSALLSATLETDTPQTPHVWDGQWPVAHADSPEAVTPPARPPPAP